MNCISMNVDLTHSVCLFMIIFDALLSCIEFDLLRSSSYVTQKDRREKQELESHFRIRSRNTIDDYDGLEVGSGLEVEVVWKVR